MIKFDDCECDQNVVGVAGVRPRTIISLSKRVGAAAVTAWLSESMHESMSESGCNRHPLMASCADASRRR